MFLDVDNLIDASGVASCQQKGNAVAIALVDRAGWVKAVLRADYAGTYTLEAGWAKAYTSASAKNATLSMMDNAPKKLVRLALVMLRPVSSTSGALLPGSTK